MDTRILVINLIIISLASCSRNNYNEELENSFASETIEVVDIPKSPVIIHNQYASIVYDKEDLIEKLEQSNSLVLANYESGSNKPIFNYDETAIILLTELVNTSDSNTYVIVGHTNSQGSKDANYVLSVNRAKKIKMLLSSKYDLKEEQIKFSGEGEKNPISSNDTSEGRSNNSRIEIRKLK